MGTLEFGSILLSGLCGIALTVGAVCCSRGPVPSSGGPFVMRIKVCCIQWIEEARLAIRAGVDALGFVSEMPGGIRGIGNQKIRRIVRTAPPTCSTVLLTSRRDPVAIVGHQKATGANTLQLVGAVEPESVLRIRDALPGISLIKVIHVVDSRAIEAATRFFEAADALMLESKVELQDGVALGGTGVTHDWVVSRQIVEASPLPVLLAGGLSPANVFDAIRAVEPFGVDVCSGLRPNGVLDPVRLRKFVSRTTGAAA